MEQKYIYVLWDPETRAPCYVGSTKDPDARLRGHLYSAFASGYGGETKVAQWVRKLLLSGLEPKLGGIDLRSTPRKVEVK